MNKIELNEEWVSLTVAPGYSVSSMGRVRNDATSHVLKPLVNPRTRYHMVRVIADLGDQLGQTGHTPKRRPGMRRRTVYVHALVALAFIGPRADDNVVDHRDRDRSNNAASNLRYVSMSANGRNSNASLVKMLLSGDPTLFVELAAGSVLTVPSMGQMVDVTYVGDRTFSFDPLHGGTLASGDPFSDYVDTMGSVEWNILDGTVRVGANNSAI